MWYTWPVLVRRRLDDPVEQLGVPRSGFAAGRIPVVDVTEEDAEECGLHRVEARVVADVHELLLRARPVEPEHAQTVREVGVVDGDEPAVAEREQVLGREEAEGGCDARGDPAGAERLRGILDHRQPEAAEVGAGRPNR